MDADALALPVLVEYAETADVSPQLSGSKPTTFPSCEVSPSDVAAWLDAAQLGPAIFEIVNAATPANVNPVQSKTASLAATGNAEAAGGAKPQAIAKQTENHTTSLCCCEVFVCIGRLLVSVPNR